MMKSTDRAIITRELQKAQSSLTHAQSMASYAGELGLAKKLRAHGVSLGETIVALQGGHEKLTVAELLPA